MTGLWQAYKLRWKRRRRLWRAFRSRHQLKPVVTRSVPKGLIALMCLRNEMARLPFVLRYYRELGVAHFLVIDNNSDDGSAEYLQEAADISLWWTDAPYREARFGIDWQNWLLRRYGHGRWCLTVDADELLIYGHQDRYDLNDLTHWLEEREQTGFGALMLDLYPNAPLGSGDAPDNPLDYLRFFDPEPYRNARQYPLQNLWTQGGVRERVFFQDAPERAPTLNKIPLIKWHRNYCYVNSTHSLLPPRLNHLYDGPGGTAASGVLLHTKFLPEVVAKSTEDLTRRQHFHDPDRLQGYYTNIQKGPNLWHPDSQEFSDWRQLAALGLMSSGGFGEN